MTLEELNRKYENLPVDGEQIGEVFAYMGRFGRNTLYSFSFETDNASIQAELCVKDGRIIGINPEKEPREEEWGYPAEEPYTEELTDEDCRRMDRYIASVLAKPEESV